MSFTAGWVEGPDGPVLVPTKSNRAHSVEIDAVTGRRLAEHAQRCRRNDDGFLFGDKNGEIAWKPNRVTKMFGRHVRAADVRPVRLHDLRHFMATQMLNRKVPIVVVARRLDHRRVSTTLDIYTHAMPGSDADAADTMADVMYGAEPTPVTPPPPAASIKGPDYQSDAHKHWTVCEARPAGQGNAL